MAPSSTSAGLGFGPTALWQTWQVDLRCAPNPVGRFFNSELLWLRHALRRVVRDTEPGTESRTRSRWVAAYAVQPRWSRWRKRALESLAIGVCVRLAHVPTSLFHALHGGGRRSCRHGAGDGIDFRRRSQTPLSVAAPTIQAKQVRTMECDRVRSVAGRQFQLPGGGLLPALAGAGPRFQVLPMRVSLKVVQVANPALASDSRYCNISPGWRLDHAGKRPPPKLPQRSIDAGNALSWLHR